MSEPFRICAYGECDHRVPDDAGSVYCEGHQPAVMDEQWVVPVDPAVSPEAHAAEWAVPSGYRLCAGGCGGNLSPNYGSDTCSDCVARGPITAVNHPPHYNQGQHEVIDVIEDWDLGFNLGNAIKYIARSAHKGSEIQDLKKAAWYLARAIDRLENP